jgi:hypothetical protein
MPYFFRYRGYVGFTDASCCPQTTPLPLDIRKDYAVSLRFLWVRDHVVCMNVQLLCTIISPNLQGQEYCRSVAHHFNGFPLSTSAGYKLPHTPWSVRYPIFGMIDLTLSRNCPQPHDHLCGKRNSAIRYSHAFSPVPVFPEGGVIDFIFPAEVSTMQQHYLPLFKMLFYRSALVSCFQSVPRFLRCQ